MVGRIGGDGGDQPHECTTRQRGPALSLCGDTVDTCSLDHVIRVYFFLYFDLSVFVNGEDYDVKY